MGEKDSIGGLSGEDMLINVKDEVPLEPGDSRRSSMEARVRVG
ncbi:hypothetical protein COLO4_37638 [Corchorus olitorius]|uniref:Uncharacterized protein n=1 Tax=Corchorus olitorius TaxID=93759 RepID=A0A1R3G0A3_9ROSI|nr:hypothetical protein COLO4_37638 [Corchorus olitorius]